MPDREGRTRVLLVEDDAALGGAVVALLAASGLEVRWAQSVTEAADALAKAEPDLVVLDLALPDGDGLSLCRYLRERGSDVVVVVLTARADETEAIRALDGGADDFVAKPFRAGELVARIRAHLRRRPTTGRELSTGPLRLDLDTRACWVNDEPVTLRPKEFELLAALVAAEGTLVSREQLINDVWDENWESSTKTLDVHIASLRRKLADAGDRWERIQTVRGYGYRLNLEADSASG